MSKLGLDKNEPWVILLFVLLTYSLFYYAYKFGMPDFGNIDYYAYYSVYKDWDFSKVESPFNTRIVSPFLVHLVYKSGIYYNAEISFQPEGYDQRVFFSAVLVNYALFVAALFVVFKTIKTMIKEVISAFLISLLYAFSFATLFYSINSLTESLASLLFAGILLAYIKRSFWIYPLMVLCVFQREYILMAMALFPAAEMWIKDQKWDKYKIQVVITAVLCFALYMVLRKTIFFTPKHANQMDVAGFLDRILNPGFPLGEYVRQSFLNQNIFLIYCGLIIYKWLNKLSFSGRDFVIHLILYGQVHLISVLAVLGNSTGRYFSILLPLTFYLLVKESLFLLRHEGKEV